MLHARQASADDLDFLWSMLFLAAHADEQPGATVASIRLDPGLDRYLGGWGRDGDLGLIATDGTEPVGAAWLRRFTLDETHLPTYVEPEIPELAIAVEPARTGQGVGSFLLDRLLGLADDGGVPAVVLSARSDNPAVHLYERFGFTVSGTIVNRVGTSSVTMVRHRPR